MNILIFIIAVLIAFLLIMTSENGHSSASYIVYHATHIIDEYNCIIGEIEIEKSEIKIKNMSLEDLVVFKKILDEIYRICDVFFDFNNQLETYVKKRKIKEFKKKEPYMEEQLIRLSELLEKIKDLKENVLKHETIYDLYNPETYCMNQDIFFHGCSTKEEIDKRYKSLVKVYHPDNTTGDSDIFKQLQNEYDKKIKEII